MGAQHLGEKLVRRHEIDACQELGECPRRSGKAQLLAGAATELLPERAAARIGQREQHLLVETEERALQHRCQSEVVLGQQQEAAERDHVLDRELLGEQQPIDAGHRHIGLFQRPHQLADESAAPAHQHHHVAGPHGTVARGEPLAAVDPLTQGLGDDAREPGGRRARVMLLDR